MKLTIEGTAKEIASLVLELQERRTVDDATNITETVIHRLQEQQI